MSARPTGRRGLLFVLSSPSGAGKTTIARRLVDDDPSLTLSVSVTTRPQRPGEIDGRDYRFIDQPRFDEMVAAGEFLEHARVFGNCYGTPRRPIEEALSAGRDIVGDLDWQGTRQLAEKVPARSGRGLRLAAEPRGPQGAAQHPRPGQRRGGRRPDGEIGRGDEPLGRI